MTNYHLWKCFDSTKLENHFHVYGLNSCQWSALGGPQSNNHLVFALSSQPWLQSLVWKSFQAPLWKSERRRSSVSVKAICDGQIFRVWKGESEKGVFTYANLTGWDWDSSQQWSDVKFVAYVLCVRGLSNMKTEWGKQCDLCRKQPWIMWYEENMNTWSGGLLADIIKLMIFLFRCLW